MYYMEKLNIILKCKIINYFSKVIFEIKKFSLFFRFFAFFSHFFAFCYNMLLLVTLQSEQ